MAGQDHGDLSVADLERLRDELRTSTERIRAELDRLVLLLIVIREHESRTGATEQWPPPLTAVPQENTGVR